MTSERFDIHQHITNQIITAIEQGPGDYQLPWHSKGSITRPVNVASGQRYRGVNILSLWAASEQSGYTSAVWGTYRQWAEAGAQVRKGERGSYIVIYKALKRAESDTEADELNASDTPMFAKATPAFAAEQVEGFKAVDAPVGSVIEPIDAAEHLVKATGAGSHHGGSRAYYRPATDSIQLPLKADFTGTATTTAQEAYYATLLHELTHWTSAPQRCDRQLGKRFGDDAYAMEELVAELGAAFLCADLGITSHPRFDHAQYLASWLDVLKADKRALFTAASAASKAVEFLKGSG